MNLLRSLPVVVALLLACALWVMAGHGGSSLPLTVLEAEMAPAGIVADPLAIDGLDWRPLDRRVLADWAGPYWVRLTLQTPPPTPATPLVLGVSLRAASELYWDGLALGSNGVVGQTSADEAPGRIDLTLPLPPGSVDGGPHELLIRASSHLLGFKPYMGELDISIAPLDQWYAQHYRRWLVAALAFGAMAVAGLYFLVGYRRRARLPRAGEGWLIVLGVVGLLLPLTEAWRPLIGYSYDLHPLRLNTLMVLHLASAALLPGYLAARFDRRWSLPWRAAYALLLLLTLAMPSFDGSNLLLHVFGLCAALAVVLPVRGAARVDAVPIAALLATTLVAMLVFSDGVYFIALAVLMVFLLLRHAAHLLALGEQNAQLRAQRAQLSSQLLHRSIHPHWLMNTLTSLQELIEQAPARASRLVDLLADEFTRLRHIGERPLIPLREEIALCRAHLEILALAHGRSIGFEVDGDIDAVELPPGLLHTLVENGLTHAGAAACATTPFRLQVRRDQGRLYMQLHSALGGGRSGSRGDGTGTRFIRSSLDAAWPGSWTFDQDADGHQWCSRIELPCAS